MTETTNTAAFTQEASTQPIASGSTIIIRDLSDYGYREAGDSRGNEQIMLTQLNLILKGHLADETSRKQLRQSKKEQLKKDIEDLRTEITQHKIEAEHIEKDTLDQYKKDKIRAQDEMDALSIQNLKEAKSTSGFDAGQYRFYLIGTIASGIACFIYYYFLFFNFLFRNPAKEIRMAEGKDKMEFLFSGFLNPDALYSIDLPYMFILIIFGTIIPLLGMFAWNSNKMKLALSIAAIFIIDCILAYLFEQKQYEIRYLANMETDPWNMMHAFSSISFYSIMLIGFTFYSTFGNLYKRLLEEKNKANPKALYDMQKEILEARLKRIDDMITELQTKLMELKKKIEQIMADIRKKEHDLNAEYYDQWDCERMMDQFLKGWLKYLSGTENGIENTRNCKLAADQFKKNFLFHNSD